MALRSFSSTSWWTSVVPLPILKHTQEKRLRKSTKSCRHPAGHSQTTKFYCHSVDAQHFHGLVHDHHPKDENLVKVITNSSSWSGPWRRPWSTSSPSLPASLTLSKSARHKFGIFRLLKSSLRGNNHVSIPKGTSINFHFVFVTKASLSFKRLLLKDFIVSSKRVNTSISSFERHLQKSWPFSHHYWP